MPTQLAAAIVLCVTLVLSACASDSSNDREPTADSIQHGAELYKAYCLNCHGGADGGQTTDVPPPHNANGHSWHHPDCQLIDLVLNGRVRDGAKMPAFNDRLTAEDVAAILVYIKTWWTDQQREFQAKVTQASC